MGRNGRQATAKKPPEPPTGASDSQRVAAALAEVLSLPGVALRFDAGIPLFTADPADPDLVVRELDGKVTRGCFKEGVFVELS
jgi:hypothetical protein